MPKFTKQPSRHHKNKLYKLCMTYKRWRWIVHGPGDCLTRGVCDKCRAAGELKYGPEDWQGQSVNEIR